MTPSIQELIMAANRLLGRLPIVIIGFAVVYFFWKLVHGVRSDNSKSRAEIRNTIAFGIGALFVMMTVWGIVKLAQRTLFPDGYIQTLGK